MEWLSPSSLAILATALGVAMRWGYARWQGHPSLLKRSYRWAIVQARLRWANDQLRAQLKAAEADRDWWATLAKECVESHGTSVSADGLTGVSAATRSRPKRTPPRPSFEPSDASGGSIPNAPTSSPKSSSA